MLKHCWRAAMFDPADPSRVYHEPPGVDFAAAVANGLIARLRDRPPEAMARVTLLVNTAQMRRRITTALQQSGARLLPDIQLIADLRWQTAHLSLPQATPPLRAQLALVGIVQKLIDTGAPFVPRASAFDLADSLTALFGEMAAEGVDPAILGSLDVTDESGHWRQAVEFLGIVQSYLSDTDLPPTADALQRLRVEALVNRWKTDPPRDPFILAGSTGSRSATTHLMRAVLDLPQGALIIPGFDDAMPPGGWHDLGDALTGEDHPQFRYARLMQALSLAPHDLPKWSSLVAPDADRNRVISLSLRPAPVTDCWLTEGPDLGPLDTAFDRVTLVEAPSRRHEALTIALGMRRATEDGKSIALVTPDRLLAREVTSALDRWDILPDDSAGTPLHLSPPGRFLLHIASLFQQKTTVSALLELLKHPLTNSGPERGDHLLLTRDLELWLRRKGVPHPEPDLLLEWAAKDKRATALPWANWIIAQLLNTETADHASLAARVTSLTNRAQAVAAGPGAADDAALWDRKAGQQTRAILAELTAEADAVTGLTAREFTALLHRLLSGQQLRDIADTRPDVMIWGPQETRAQHADIVILGGLNESSWPENPAADPWLNRQMRHQAGLLLPERRIGLSAHDYQQAVAAPEVWLTRSRRSDDAETVPSRWLNRLTNLLGGLTGNGGPDAIQAMTGRGQAWLDLAASLENATPGTRAPRPSPRPPVVSRPRELSVTEIARLIRDPYAIYARHILRLKPLDPLDRAPDALLRGIVVHKALESFVRALDAGTARLRHEDFMAHVRQRLDQAVPWPSTHALWMARMNRVADWFLAGEAARRNGATPLAHEATGTATLPAQEFTLTGRADRIDRDSDGNWLIYDYKTGNPPSTAQQRAFDKQLPLLAAIAEFGAFDDIGSRSVHHAAYIGLGTTPKESAADLIDYPPARVWRDFETLIAHFGQRDSGYTARRRLTEDRDKSDYDHLSRYGEWLATDDPEPEDVG